jgi:hypothetical protein
MDEDLNAITESASQLARMCDEKIILYMHIDSYKKKPVSFLIYLQFQTVAVNLTVLHGLKSKFTKFAGSCWQ